MTVSPEQFADHLARIEAETGIQYGPGTLRLPNGSRMQASHTAAVPLPGAGEGGGIGIRSIVMGRRDMPHHIDVGDFQGGVGMRQTPLHYSSRILSDRGEHPDFNSWESGNFSNEWEDGDWLRAESPKEWANRAVNSMNTFSAGRIYTSRRMGDQPWTHGMLWHGGANAVFSANERTPDGKAQTRRDRRYVQEASRRTSGGLHIPVFGDDDFSGMMDWPEIPEQQDSFNASKPKPEYGFDLSSRRRA